MGIILTDLSKAYDCLPYGFLVAKFEAYGIEKIGLNLLHNYLKSHKKRTKVSSFNNDWYNVL